METPLTIPVAEQVKQYLETTVKRLKLQGIDNASEIVAVILTDMVMVILALLTFILLSITLALFAAHLLNSYWEGFGCVTAFYALLILVARLLRISLQNLFVRLFIKRVFKRK